MRLEEVPHFDLYPETFLATRAQVEVKVKVSSAVLLPVQKNFKCCLYQYQYQYFCCLYSLNFFCCQYLMCSLPLWTTCLLPTCQLAYLPTCLYVYLSACIFAYSSVQLTSLHYLPYPADPPPWPPPPPPL